MTPSTVVREKILLVDDTVDVLKSLCSAVAESFRVVTARGAAEALSMIERDGPFAVVVSDLELEGQSGVDLVDSALRTGPDTVAILLANLTDVAEAIRPLYEGRVPRFLQREHAPASLHAALESALDEHRSRARARRDSGALRFSCGALEDFNSELVERLKAQTGAIHRLHRFVDDLNRTDSVEEMAQHAADAAFDVAGGRAVRVRLWDHVDGRSLATAGKGGDVSRECCAVEITTHEGQTGDLLVDLRSANGRRLTAVEDNLLCSIASSTAASVYNQLRRSERDEAQHATILALARLAEQRDNETGKHLERVSLYCRLTADGLRADGHHQDVITDAWIGALVRSAPLHDIGKVGIPDAILLKPGKLDPAEWEVMKTHAEIGADCLRGVIDESRKQGSLQMSLDIAECHHERWDGTGYPRGLAGSAIPLCARILALADVYDALTTVRPYKQAWTHESAIEWIGSVAGTHLDPDVVRSFLARASEADAIRARLADRVEDFESPHRAAS